MLSSFYLSLSNSVGYGYIIIDPETIGLAISGLLSIIRDLAEMVDRSENELDEAKISIVRGIVIFSFRATVIAVTVFAGQIGTHLKLTSGETGISS